MKVKCQNHQWCFLRHRNIQPTEMRMLERIYHGRTAHSLQGVPRYLPQLQQISFEQQGCGSESRGESRIFKVLYDFSSLYVKNYGGTQTVKLESLHAKGILLSWVQEAGDNCNFQAT